MPHAGVEPPRHGGIIPTHKGVTRAEAAAGKIREGTAADFFPSRRTLAALRTAAASCRACHLWMLGTQTVFGEGPRAAKVMLVGEQPGDQEDKAGKPFVGPAGALLDEVLAQAAIDRSDVYVTNIVKHFKWERGEKSARRIHKKPNDSEVTACRPWLEAEIAQVKPAIIVALGATAAQAMLGKSFRVTKDHGKPIDSSFGVPVIATIHPSAVLRAPTPAARRDARAGLLADLAVVARRMSSRGG